MGCAAAQRLSVGSGSEPLLARRPWPLLGPIQSGPVGFGARRRARRGDSLDWLPLCKFLGCAGSGEDPPQGRALWHGRLRAPCAGWARMEVSGEAMGLASTISAGGGATLVQ